MWVCMFFMFLEALFNLCLVDFPPLWQLFWMIIYPLRMRWLRDIDASWPGPIDLACFQVPCWPQMPLTGHNASFWIHIFQLIFLPLSQIGLFTLNPLNPAGRKRKRPLIVIAAKLPSLLCTTAGRFFCFLVGLIKGEKKKEPFLWRSKWQPSARLCWYFLNEGHRSPSAFSREALAWTVKNIVLESDRTWFETSLNHSRST